MTPTPLASDGPPPSSRRVVAASLASLLSATALLFIAVLPAEYGVDPLGTGHLLGLMPAPVAESATVPTPSGLTTPLIPTSVGPIQYFQAPFSTDTATFLIGPYDYVEYKYRLERGAGMTFAWKASAPVTQDLHGDPDGADDHDEQSFDRRQGSEASGTHTAPFAGLHGWMWENPGGTPITVTLTSAGFYSSATEFRPNRRQFPHPLVPALK